VTQANDYRAALRYAEGLLRTERDQMERAVIASRVQMLRQWLSEHDGQHAGAGLGMPGQSWDSFENAIDPQPIRVAMPTALPGGKWGAQSFSFGVQTDALGNFVKGGDPRNLYGETGCELLRAEWPIATTWALQVYWSYSGPQGVFLPGVIETLQWGPVVQVTGTVDNAHTELRLPLNAGAGVYPLQYAIGSTGGGAPVLQSLDIVAQQVTVSVIAFGASNDAVPPPNPPNADITIVVQAVIGLWSASLPPQRGAMGSVNG